MTKILEPKNSKTSLVANGPHAINPALTVKSNASKNIYLFDDCFDDDKKRYKRKK